MVTGGRPEEGVQKAKQAPEERSIFRAEALAHRARAEGPGNVIRFAPKWAGWAFYGVLGLFIVTLIASSLITIDRWVPGTFTTDGEGRAFLIVPAALAADVATGSSAEIGGERTTVTAVSEKVLSPAEIDRRYQVDVTAPSIVLTTDATGRLRSGPDRVLVESEPVIVALVPGLKALFGDA